MSFNWNINNWIRMMLPPHLVKPKMEAWIKSLLTPIDTAKETYLTETRINGQTIVLETYLNDLFDPTNKGIEIKTISDLLPANYIYLNIENQPAKYIYQAIETTQNLWLYQTIQYGDNSGFKVLIPTSLIDKSKEVLAIVNKYKLAGKTVIIEEK